MIDIFRDEFELPVEDWPEYLSYFKKVISESNDDNKDQKDRDQGQNDRPKLHPGCLFTLQGMNPCRVQSSSSRTIFTLKIKEIRSKVQVEQLRIRDVLQPWRVEKVEGFPKAGILFFARTAFVFRVQIRGGR